MKILIQSRVESRGSKAFRSRGFFGPRPSTLDLRPSQRGVALIITLILLSVTLLMALAFLAISTRERGSVETTTDAATARLAADSALAQAESQIISSILSTTNPYNFGLLVSTNYINPNGFDPANVNPFENVNYDHLLGVSTPLSAAQFLILYTNLWYEPRAPVWLTNSFTHLPENRFYLDLNRNGKDDPNGFVTNVDNTGKIILDASNNPVVNFQVGDPEWVGVLERPDTSHGPDNHFLSRYAFIAMPVGNSLDLNAIHNQAFTKSVADINNDGFLRNQGVGSWEINLAAFLADLNTNEWDNNLSGGVYQYRQINTPNLPNSGAAFNDAFSILSYRYANNYNSLASVQNLFGVNGFSAFEFDNIDGYSDGPLQMSFDTNEDFFVNNDNPLLPWAGADNTNHFFTPEELFDTNKTEIGVSGLGFTGRLLQAGMNYFGGTTNSTYDRYTFYRLLSQLGTDTTPDSGKMNLNYDNLDPYVSGPRGAGVTNAPSATNFMAWQPQAFFTNAANRMLRAYTAEWFAENPTNFMEAYYGVIPQGYVDASGLGVTNLQYFGQTNQVPAFGVTNIPVLIGTNFVYEPAVNRLLQLAANIYDATTTNFYPDVFKPVFRNTNGNVFITGYTNVASVSGYNDPVFQLPVDADQLPVNTANIQQNVYGVPWIIGAKKGFPNFNEFSMESVVGITRKLQFTRPSLGASIGDYVTNQMYIMSISNSLGVECWNSYYSNYAGNVQIVVADNLTMVLTNDNGMSPVSTNLNLFSSLPPTNITVWQGSAWTSSGLNVNPNSFIIPLNTNVVMLTNSVYVYKTKSFIPVAQDPSNYLDTGISPLPNFGLMTTNRLRVWMLDSANGVQHVIDYVQFAGPDGSRDLSAEIADPDSDGDTRYLWSTNYYPGTSLPWGVYEQYNVSQGADPVPSGDGGAWQPPSGQGGVSPSQQQAIFEAFFFTKGFNGIINSQLTMQAPYTPTRYVYQYTSWQANDPLVHYLASDLNYTNKSGSWNTANTDGGLLLNLGKLNNRYLPWGTPRQSQGTDANAYNLALQDPLVYASDDWDFPTNKFPTAGWLGRVHRGTPWQTVYLKATNILDYATTAASGFVTWTKWTGNVNPFDAVNAAPVQDRLLFDIFTTAFDDNAARGTLSVNQAQLAAWSALFSGVMVLSNTASDTFVNSRFFHFPRPALATTNWVINPVGITDTNSPLWQIVNHTTTGSPGIDEQRSVFTNMDGLVGAYEHAGDILSVPALTQLSPFLNLKDASQLKNGISDEEYEWLPQQVMSLLRSTGSPRYVIYSYGQTLKPAPKGIVTSGQFFGMVTNYQIVSETATRSVVRFDSALTNTTINVNGILTPTLTVTNNRAVIESFNLLPPD